MSCYKKNLQYCMIQFRVTSVDLPDKTNPPHDKFPDVIFTLDSEKACVELHSSLRCLQSLNDKHS